MVEEVKDSQMCLPFIHESLGRKISKWIISYYVTKSSGQFFIMSSRFHNKPAWRTGDCHDHNRVIAMS